MSRYLRELWQKPVVLLLLTVAGASGAIGLVALSARRTYNDLEAASAERQVAYEFLMALRLLRQHVGEARVGMTGYVLTHDSAYRATYLNGIAGFRTDTLTLRSLVRGQPTLDRSLDRLHPTLLAYENALAKTAASSEGQPIAALQRDVRGSRDFVLLDDIRVVFVELEREQKRLLDVGAREVEVAVRRSKAIITLATGLGAVLVLVAGGLLLVQIRARERISRALRRHEQQLSSIHDTVADALFQLAVEPDGDFRFVSVNRAFLTTTGLRADQVVGHRTADVIPGPSLPRALARYRQAVAGKRTVRWEDLSAYPAGTVMGEVSVTPVLDAAGNCTFLVGVVHDTTERMLAEGALRESEERFREMAAHIKEAFFIVDLATGRPLYVSPTWAEIWGRPIEDGYDRRIWLDAVHPDDRAEVRAARVAVAHGEDTVNVFRVTRPDGTLRWVRDRAFPVRDAMGHVHRLAGVSEDITEQRHAEERSLHAQKMEAIGRLAGGVAHDFNNLLSVILAQTDLTRSDLTPDDPNRDALGEIRTAALRGAALTRQLLAFARHQVVEPVVFSVNDTVSDVETMVRRLIGEDIEVATHLAADDPFVRADPGQFAHMLMNLAVNARDAMPNGGRLTLETANVTLDEAYAKSREDVTPGDYVLLAVSDNGFGMADDVMKRIFEPFFTTKEYGKGTGLGLATSYGFVKQAGGHLAVSSEPGVGTTFKVYLPRSGEPLALDEAPNAEALPRGSEAILL